TQTVAYELSGSVRYGETRDNLGHETGENAFGSHLFGTGRFQIDDIWRWGFDTQLTSNDTYLKRYDISSLDRLVNNAFIEGIYGRSYASVNTWVGVRQVFEPIVQAILAPFGGNPNTIPNEDSASFEFDETNLFSYNKFPGDDRVETGPRMNAGVRYAAYFEDGVAEAIVGE